MRNEHVVCVCVCVRGCTYRNNYYFFPAHPNCSSAKLIRLLSGYIQATVGGFCVEYY